MKRSRQVPHEDRFSREENIETLQAFFYDLIGRHDLTGYGQTFTLRQSECEEFLNVVPLEHFRGNRDRLGLTIKAFGVVSKKLKRDEDRQNIVQRAKHGENDQDLVVAYTKMVLTNMVNRETTAYEREVRRTYQERTEPEYAAA